MTITATTAKPDRHILRHPLLAARSRGAVVRLATATVLTGLAITATGGTAAATPSTPGPMVTGSGSGSTGPNLVGLLLTGREASTTLGADLVDVATGPGLDTTRVQPTRCSGAYTPGAATAFDGTDPQDLAVKVVSDGQGTSVTEMVVQLPTKKAALDHMAATADGWSDCQGLTVTASGKSWILGAPMVNDARTMVTLSQTFGGPGRGSCERAIATYYDVFIDVLTCSSRAAGEGAAITQAIADKANSRPV